MNLAILSAVLIAICGFIYGIICGFGLVCQGILALWLSKLRTKRLYNEIDPKIAPLVNKMNATGVIRTVASCQGHFCTGSPYVYFLAPMEIAAAIERRLREASMCAEQWKSTGWSIVGRFNGEYKLAFAIRSPEHDGNYWKFWWSTWQYWIMRKRLDAELVALAEVVEEAILLQLRKGNPRIDANGN